MEAHASVNQPPPKNGQGNQKRFMKRKQPQHSADIVFTKGASVHTMPSLSKQLKGVTECIIGLQFVWEYRSPSKSVAPHYQCKLCAVSRLQHDMLAHVKGWKHSFRYLKKVYPDKIIHDEGEAVKDPAIRKTIKDVAAEVENTDGRGQIRVILKEPFEVPAFKGLRSAAPKIRPPLPPGMGGMGPPPGMGGMGPPPGMGGMGPPPGMGAMGPPPFGPRFSDLGGPGPNYPMGGTEEQGFGGYSNMPNFHDSDVDQRPFSDHMGHHSTGDSFGKDGYGRSGLLDSPSRMYPDEFRDNQMGSSLMKNPVERPGLMGTAPEGSSLPTTLLNYLDTFRIENESDAQLVLKVTQKLTDVLMEYRLRSVSKGSSLSTLSMSSTSFSSTPSRLPNNIGRFSSSLPGPSRFSERPPRYFK